jgi:hypothetical protein
VAWALGGEAEFIIAIIFGAYGKGNAAIATLIGSKVNQWTFSRRIHPTDEMQADDHCRHRGHPRPLRPGQPHADPGPAGNTDVRVGGGLVWANDDTLDGGPGQDKHSSCGVVLWTISPVDT